MRFGPLVALSCLVFQNASINLLVAYSRHSNNSKELYTPAVLVLTTELLKILLCIVLALCQTRSEDRQMSLSGAWRRLVLNALDAHWLQTAIPALLYTASNNLAYYGISRVDVPTYVLVMQGKLLSSALFNTVIFHRRLRVRQWLALLILALGVVFAQHDFQTSPTSTALLARPERWAGLMVLGIACLFSGLAGSILEDALKHPRGVSLWERNIHIALPSLVFSAAALALDRPAARAISASGLWHGFDSTVWLIVVDQLVGGLLVSYLVQAVGTVIKGFATAMAIVATTWASFRLRIGQAPRTSISQLAIASGLVVTATLLYSSAGAPSLPKPKARKRA